MKKYLFLLILLLALSISYAQEKNYTATETDITSPNGEQFTITLDANHTTGYSWTAVVSDSTILGTEGSDYVTPAVKVMGRGGQEVWRFRGVLQGTTTITFKYAKPWEKDTPPAKTIVYNVTVQ